MGTLDALAASPEALRRFLESLPVAVAVFDRAGKIVARNQRFSDVVGADPETLSAVPLHAPDGQALGEASPLRRAAEGQDVDGQDVIVARPDGSTRAARASTITLGAGGLLALADPPGTDTLLKQILGIVGHDLRNPLAAIRMTAQLLSKAGPMADDRRITLSKRIVSSSGRMDALVRGLLEFARAQAGAFVRLAPEASDLEAIVGRAVEDQEHAFPGRTIERTKTGDTTGHWDPERLEMVVGQLVSNALRHGQDPVTVTLDGSARGEVVVTVSNQGAIPDETQAAMFEPFAIGPRAPGAPRRNIGLGLFVARYIVEGHGGEISATSAAGNGTTFRVRLPRGNPQSQGESVTSR